MSSISRQIEPISIYNPMGLPYESIRFQTTVNESLVRTDIQEEFLNQQKVDPFFTLQQELESLLGEYSKDGKIFSVSVKNTEKIDTFSKEYEDLIQKRSQMDKIIAKEPGSLSKNHPLLDKYKEIMTDISNEYNTCKEVLLKTNKEISNYYSEIQDLLDTVKYIKSKNYDEETTTFFIGKMNEKILKLQESKVIKELKIKAEKAIDKIYEINSIVQHYSFCEKNMCFCDENPIQVALVPCGHTFCNSCLPPSTKKCHMCRSNFTSKMKIYLN
jgi:hypothetical protein